MWHWGQTRLDGWTDDGIDGWKGGPPDRRTPQILLCWRCGNFPQALFFKEQNFVKEKIEMLLEYSRISHMCNMSPLFQDRKMEVAFQDIICQFVN